MTFKKLYSISFEFHEEYDKNLNKLINYIEDSKENSIIVAPELCLTNFSFERLEEAAIFSQSSLKKLLPLSKNRVITFSMITKEGEKFFNTAITLYNNKIQHKQSKYRLFKFGNEHKYYTPGNFEDIKIFHINNIRLAILICFEIRFIDLWKKIQGADIIMIPALWGKLRKKQLEIITQAMAVINQAYVIVANSKNSDMADSSAIITPFGERVLDDNKNILSKEFKISEIKKMRKYMNIGLS